MVSADCLKGLIQTGKNEQPCKCMLCMYDMPVTRYSILTSLRAQDSERATKKSQVVTLT